MLRLTIRDASSKRSSSKASDFKMGPARLDPTELDNSSKSIDFPLSVHYLSAVGTFVPTVQGHL